MTMLMDFTNVGRTRMAEVVTDALVFQVTHIAYGSSGFNAGTPTLALPLNPAATALVAEVFRKQISPSQITIDTVGPFRGQETVFTTLGGTEITSIMGEAGLIATVTDPGTTGLSIGDEFLLAQAHFPRIVFTLFQRLAIKWPLDFTAPAVIYTSLLSTLNDVISLTPTILGPGFAAFALTGGTLPTNLTLNPVTGEISGTVGIDDLLGGTPAGDYTGLEVTADGTVPSPAFDIRVLGVSLPDPATVGGVYLTGDLLATVGTEVLNNVDGVRLDEVGTVNSVAGLVAGEAFDWADVAGLRDSTNPLSKTAKQLSVLMTLQLDTKTSDRNTWAHGSGPAANTGVKLGYDQGTDKFYAQWDGNASSTTLVGTTTPATATTYTLGLSLREDAPPNQFGKLFVDGVKEDESASVHDVDFGTNPFEVGIYTPVAGEGHDGKLDEFLWLPSVDLSEDQQATAAWLAKRGDTLAGWIKGQSPSVPTYANQNLLNGTLVTFSPLTPSSDPETATVTYVLYDALPTGLTLNASTGDISGTPTVNGFFQVRVAVTDGMHLVVSPQFDIFVS